MSDSQFICACVIGPGSLVHCENYHEPRCELLCYELIKFDLSGFTLALALSENQG